MTRKSTEIKISREKFLEWKKLAELGYSGAIKMMAICYEQGIYVEKNPAQSQLWMEKYHQSISCPLEKSNKKSCKTTLH